MKTRNTTNNGLRFFSVKSESEPLGIINVTDYTALNKFLGKNFEQNGIVVAYLDYAVLIRNYINKEIVFMKDEQPFDPKFIQKLRLFNRNMELFIWRTDDNWNARLRKDTDTETGLPVIEANQLLFGTTAKLTNGFTLLTEDRGTEVMLPFEIKNVDTGKNRVKIKTRNYISYNEIGQAGFNDCRFVEFTFGFDNKSLGGN